MPLFSHRHPNPLPLFSMKHKAVIFVIVLVSLFFCIYLMKTQEGSATTAVDVFHDHYSSGRFDAIWDAARPDYRASFPSREQFTRQFQDTLHQLGKVKSSRRLSQHEGSLLKWIRKLTITQQTAFEKEERMEVFTFEIIQQQPLLLAYELRKSPPE